MKLPISNDPLESALRRDAARLNPPVPAGLERRIAALVSQETPPFERSWWQAGGSAWVPLAAAAALVLAAVGIRSYSGLHSMSAGDPAGDRVAAAELAQTVKGLPGQVWSRVQPGASRLLQEDPLRQEATDLFSDARSAVGFLAVNFLPTSAPIRARSLAPAQG